MVRIHGERWSFLVQRNENCLTSSVTASRANDSLATDLSVKPWILIPAATSPSRSLHARPCLASSIDPCHLAKVEQQALGLVQVTKQLFLHTQTLAAAVHLTVAVAVLVCPGVHPRMAFSLLAYPLSCHSVAIVIILFQREISSGSSIENVWQNQSLCLVQSQTSLGLGL
jgi:hypothetical protein